MATEERRERERELGRGGGIKKGGGKMTEREDGKGIREDKTGGREKGKDWLLLCSW